MQCIDVNNHKFNFKANWVYTCHFDLDPWIFGCGDVLGAAIVWRLLKYCVAIVKLSVAAINSSIYFTVASPIKLQFMSRGYVQGEIDKLKLNPKFDIKLQTELDRRSKKGSSDEPPAKATRSETGKANKQKKRKPPVKERVQAKSRIVPKDQAQWVGRGLAIASHFNLNNINQVLKLNKYVFANGQWEVFPTPKNGSCMFAAFRRGLEATEEFRNCHLRYMVALFLWPKCWFHVWYFGGPHCC